MHKMDTPCTLSITKASDGIASKLTATRELAQVTCESIELLPENCRSFSSPAFAPRGGRRRREQRRMGGKDGDNVRERKAGRVRGEHRNGE